MVSCRFLLKLGFLVCVSPSPSRLDECRVPSCHASSLTRVQRHNACKVALPLAFLTDALVKEQVTYNLVLHPLRRGLEMIIRQNYFRVGDQPDNSTQARFEYAVLRFHALSSGKKPCAVTAVLGLVHFL
jgi:hypothetical protein